MRGSGSRCQRYTRFTPNDAGTRVFSATLVFLNEDAVIIAADLTSPMISDQSGFISVRGAAVGYRVAVQSDPIFQDERFNITVTAVDINGNVAVGYTGGLTILKDTDSSDDNFESHISFSASDMGSLTIQVTFHVQGSLTFWDDDDFIPSVSTGTISFSI